MTVLGITISIGLAFVKHIASYLGYSYALVADATETAADVFSSGLLWLGLRIAMKPADMDHPHGHGKVEPLGAVHISLFLLAAAAWIGWHAVHFIRTPQQMPRRFTLGILLVVILIKERMFWYVLKIGEQINIQAVKSDAYRHRSDAIKSVAHFLGYRWCWCCVRR